MSDSEQSDDTWESFFGKFFKIKFELCKYLRAGAKNAPVPYMQLLLIIMLMSVYIYFIYYYYFIYFNFRNNI